MKLRCDFVIAVTLFVIIAIQLKAQPYKNHNLRFDSLPASWEKGFPLGNGMLGVLVWNKEGKLRLAIDRADLWDLRPTAEIHKYSYNWAYEHRLSGDWDTVWKVADEPYDRDPAPTKLPGVAIEFDISQLGRIASAELDIASAMCTIVWKNGTVFSVFVDATSPIIRYKWLNADIKPVLVPPAYASKASEEGNHVVEGADLKKLGYLPGKIVRNKNKIVYTQKAWGLLTYQAAVAFNNGSGTACISSHYSDKPKEITANKKVTKAILTSFDEAATNHKQWWHNYWAQSSVNIPDKKLEKQYYLEIYKLGAASRKGAPPISLQAVWTADNGKLPPWKGDFHNDLNTQLSYWPAYGSNHLEEASVFTDWLWENKPYFRQYTRRVFGTDGLNVPGVATLRGHEMGGWHMYAMSPTVSCWLAQHFYLQWRYSMDWDFLVTKAFPWISEAARHIEQVTVFKNGSRLLPMSSSPEFHDGGINAWFLEMTNYDRALTRYIFNIASELAETIGRQEEAKHWKQLENQLPGFDIDESSGLTIAPGFPYQESHRHFSHLMAIHPLGLISFDDEKDRQTIRTSVANLEKQGPDWWCGYSYSWLGNIYAWMNEGDKAADALSKFASCFCSVNSFHLNGDQCKAGYSNFTYNPFTLEGNFAFAAGIQEMLLQSHTGIIQVFPAIPSAWKDVSFSNLRTQGAFLISAAMHEGVIETITIKSEKGGTARIRLPFNTFYFARTEKATPNKPFGKELVITLEPGGLAEIKNGYE